jgi:diguanylate cyclase (GGDEF)-like protein
MDTRISIAMSIYILPVELCYNVLGHWHLVPSCTPCLARAQYSHKIMFEPREDPVNGSAERDLLKVYRKRIWSLFGVISIGLFLPSSLFILFQGFRALAVSVLLMLAILGLNGFSRIRNKAPRLMLSLFVASLTFTTGLSLLERGVFGVFWTFPAILFISFLAFGRLARAYTAIYFIYVGSLMFVLLDVRIAARASIGLLMTVLFTNFFVDMIEKLHKKLITQSTVDPLTGALNRRQMDSILQEAIERKRRTHMPASLLVFDIDQFKSVNDTYGHAVGDHVLKELVSLVHSRARLLDRLFRQGGEEFMLFLPDTDCHGAAVLAEELRLLISEGDFIDDRVITISIGISELELGETIDEWIKRGDDALFSAKHNGRNQIVEALLAEAYC